MSINVFLVPENLESTHDDIISPSGKYKLSIGYYKTKQGCWNYTKGTITNLSDNSIVAEIGRNYGTFHNGFFTKDNQEWMWTGKTYLSQCFINLETGRIHENSESPDIKSSSFCWTDVHPNTSGTLLAVAGCVWGAPYEIKFYDFSDPSKGWPHLELSNYRHDYSLSLDSGDFKWIDDTTFEYIGYYEFCTELNKKVDDMTTEDFKLVPEDIDFEHRFYYKVVIKYSDSAMSIIETVSSPEHLQDIEDYKIFEQRLKQLMTDLKTNNPTYLALSSEFKAGYIFMFGHNDKLYDFDTPIQNTHFGFSVDGYDLRCFEDKIELTNLKLKVKEEFKSVQDCIDYIQKA